MLRRFASIELMFINSWSRWQARTVRKHWQIVQCIVFCSTSQSYHAANNSTGSLPVHSSLTISPSLSVIRTSSGKAVQCNNDVRYNAPTPEVRDYAPKCGFAHDRTNGLRVQRLVSQHVLFLPLKHLGTLWCDKWMYMCTHSAQLIFSTWAVGDPRIVAHMRTSTDPSTWVHEVACTCDIGWERLQYSSRER